MVMFHLEDKHSGAGQDVDCSLSMAIVYAKKNCVDSWHRWTIWSANNTKIGEVSREGIVWLDPEITPTEEVPTPKGGIKLVLIE